MCKCLSAVVSDAKSDTTVFPYGRTESQPIALKMGKVEDFYSKNLVYFCNMIRI